VSLQPAVVVHYIDFGNESEISPENLAVLPDDLKLEPPLVSVQKVFTPSRLSIVG